MNSLPATTLGEGSLSRRPVVRSGLLACAVMFLVWFAWQALAGGLRQMHRSRTLGQKIETAVQLETGLMSLLVALTCFWQRQWAQPVRALWSIDLATTAGLSSLVWGPPMPLVGVLFVAIATLVSRAVTWALRIALAG